jgi:hypothetical protein
MEWQGEKNMPRFPQLKIHPDYPTVASNLARMHIASSTGNEENYKRATLTIEIP